ncbi:hypothetical protein [Mesorhizobium sp. L-8-3]|uniref:hypothetical protein n=1 Tax=Mesorhizobium sp. L-8-3 TaxID=2744522 RepID=UPI0019268A1D|nr:hypothetical protein [Mesorhizobium sp. L-8-3]BCH24113.1 hypothetical protein MesoLjLb_38980 [Mesorhizobium sp. L-8-3]
MTGKVEEWRPGSFTKNFSWGSERGFAQLYESIRIGFDLKMEDIPREEFRQRLEGLGRPVYIPINFFLFNRQRDGIDYLIADELVFQAISGNHSPRFDKLALFAFNFSYVGVFKGAQSFQRRPALWANGYVKERLAKQLEWDTRRVSADDIEAFLISEPRYVAQTARKVATNLAHLYKIGRISDLKTDRVDRWWVDALFLALDRLIEDKRIAGVYVAETEYATLLQQSDFAAVSGKRSLEKDLATKHLVRLYTACGGRDRFSDEAVEARTNVLVRDVESWVAPNDPDPKGAIHPTNVRILKSIPAACAMLAIYAGFDVIGSMLMDEFDADEFIRDHTRAALDRLKREGIQPTMTTEEVLKLTREA